MTISADSTARLWNYDNMKCEVVHSFRSDEPISVAIHSSGIQGIFFHIQLVFVSMILIEVLMSCDECFHYFTAKK